MSSAVALAVVYEFSGGARGIHGGRHGRPPVVRTYGPGVGPITEHPTETHHERTSTAQARLHPHLNYGAGS